MHLEIPKTLLFHESVRGEETAMDIPVDMSQANSGKPECRADRKPYDLNTATRSTAPIANRMI